MKRGFEEIRNLKLFEYSRIYSWKMETFERIFQVKVGLLGIILR